MEWIANPEIWISLITLTVLEIVLGIDNIIFISIMASKLPANKQKKARQLGLALAMITRVLLLLSLSWIMTLTSPLFNAGEWIGLSEGELFEKFAISGRDLILLSGGLFLIYKSTTEIHDKLEGEEHKSDTKAVVTFSGVIIQILILDVVFSLDSVITAVGMANQISIMVLAMLISMVIMLISANGISDFVNRHPTIKILALSFLLLIGVMLTVEGMGGHIAKGYIYFAMSFSFVVELLNMRYRKKVPAGATPGNLVK